MHELGQCGLNGDNQRARFEIVRSLFASVRERQKLKALLPYSNDVWVSEM